MLQWPQQKHLELDVSLMRMADEIAKGFRDADDVSIAAALQCLLPKLKQVEKLLEEFDKAQEGNATYSF